MLSCKRVSLLGGSGAKKMEDYRRKSKYRLRRMSPCA
jgi:hypothetical protein